MSEILQLPLFKLTLGQASVHEASHLLLVQAGTRTSLQMLKQALWPQSPELLVLVREKAPCSITDLDLKVGGLGGPLQSIAHRREFWSVGLSKQTKGTFMIGVLPKLGQQCVGFFLMEYKQPPQHQ